MIKPNDDAVRALAELRAITPKDFRAYHSAIDKAESALSRPTAATGGGVETALEQAAKIADAKASDENSIFEQAADDRALSDSGRIAIQDRALARNTVARTIAREIRRLALPKAREVHCPVPHYVEPANAALASTPSQAVQAEAGPLVDGTREEIARIIAEQLGEDWGNLVDEHLVADIFCQEDFLRCADAVIASAATRTGER